MVDGVKYYNINNILFIRPYKNMFLLISLSLFTFQYSIIVVLLSWFYKYLKFYFRYIKPLNQYLLTNFRKMYYLFSLKPSVLHLIEIII